MAGAWTFAGEPASGGAAPGTVTLLEGTTFCISSSTGDIEPGTTHGLFLRDTRFCSCWRLLLDGVPTQPVSAITAEPFAATFVSRLRPAPGRSDPGLIVVRRRYIGDGMREDVSLRNLAAHEIACELSFEIGADFAHIFEVKEDRVRPRGFHSVEVVDGAMVYAFRLGDRSRRLAVSLPEGSDAGPGAVVLHAVVPPKSDWATCFEFAATIDEVAITSRHRCGQPVGVSAPAAQLREWRWQTPRISVGHDGYGLALSQAVEDLGALRIFDPEHPADAPVIAAGAPWFMALFGRDSLITSYMTLLVDPRIATGTLRSLALHQGRRVDEETEEQPGKILHELRFGTTGPGRATATAYYGSIDATPLFVVAFGEAVRFGLERPVVDELLPAVDAALEWVATYGDRDGDGFVEYERSGPQGLANQGWKDSWDGVTFADGSLARPPIALAEVQGYVFAAYCARAEVARMLGDEAGAARFAALADELKRRFNAAFYLPERGYFAFGLDGEKAPIDALASNMGHCLWSGIVDEDKAPQAAAALVSPEMFSGWGVRTLATSMGAYNPMSYHNGSVWPHDTALCAAGLMRYGLVEEAGRLVLGLIDAAEALGGRLPELFCGFERSEFFDPVAYPAACSPQAWASASLFSLLRTALRFDPLVPAGRAFIAPAIPAAVGTIRLENVSLGTSRIAIEAGGPEVRVHGLPEGFELIEAPAGDALAGG